MATLTPDSAGRYELKKDRYGHAFKVGSTWEFMITRKIRDPATSVETAVPTNGMVPRIMMRKGSETGELVLLYESDKITLGGDDGSIAWTVMPTDSVKFAGKAKVFIDVEMTPSNGKTWQSPTYFFKTIPQVTTP